ncbi:outer membrane adhesin like protein [Leptothrix cholodnii SP-6]|uniref:Outer membrane adhesin like protein n=1 Tax=Leptothrix cholodnii (strain ATCC 51168 / LMG 8142 / SP-6) TaxID=395495 RepID=B1Y5U7_LEPCP|nr:putative Ig domain-containing protein [Leptothrix cholodnii]ACB35993.1 outer membrane adhesin like protein [Leptothrix cholodnii SP-6]
MSSTPNNKSWKKHHTAPAPRAWALEARLMFDAAAVADAVHQLSAETDTHVLDLQASSAAQTTTASAVETTPHPIEGLFRIATAPGDVAPTLLASQAEAQRLLQEFAQRPDAREQLFALFNGNQAEPSAEWTRAADAYLAALRSGEVSIEVQLRSAADLKGNMGAFSVDGADGQPVIYLNADWVASGVATDALTRVLAEEFGHGIDHALNGSTDTTGDEGEAFAAVALNLGLDPTQQQRITAEDDHTSLVLDGHALTVELAGTAEVSVPFSEGYIGTVGTSTGKANNILNFSTLGITRASFFQDSTTGSFGGTQGNDLSGGIRLTLASGQVITINGAINWRDTAGSTLYAFGFIPDPATPNIAISYGSGQTYTITSSSNFGLETIGVTYSVADGSNVSGNAATSGLLTSLNTYLAEVQASAPGGPVTVTSLSTSDSTPTLGGTATLGANETLTVIVNGTTYTTSTGLTLGAGSTWSLTIPDAKLLANATYGVTATITNASGYTLTDTTSSELIVNTALPSNVAPTADAVSTSGTEDAASITVALSATDSDGTVASYTIATLPANGTLYTDAARTQAVLAGTPFSTSTLYFVPTAHWNGSTSFGYVATDDGGASSTSTTASITVSAVNDAPVVLDDAQTTAENTVLHASVVPATDVDAPPEIQDTGTLDFTIANRTFSFFGPETGSNEFNVNVGSGPTGFGSAAAMAAAFQAHPNYALLPYTIGVNAAGDGLQLDFKVSGNYGGRGLEKWGDGPSWLTTLREGQDLVYSVVTDVPAGQGTLSFNADGSYDFDPGTAFDDLAPGASRSTTFTYTATDPDGSAAVARTVTITVTGANDAPTVAASLADAAATQGTGFSHTVPAGAFADVDVGDTRSYTATLADGSALPAWLSFDAATRTFSGTPANADVGTISVKVTAFDGSSATADDTFDIVVTDVNDAPSVANPIADQAATEDSPFSFTVPANAFADVDVGDTRSYTATLADGAALPAWLSFDPATRTFSGTPANADVGTISVKVTATDSGQATADDTFDIVVANVNDTPVLADTPLALTVAEDAGTPVGAVGSLIGAFTGGSSDADTGAAKGIAITGADTSKGSWYYTTDGGANWQALGAVSATSARVLADDGNTRLYFKPAAHANGDVTAGLTFKAWDQNGGHANGTANVDTLGGAALIGGYNTPGTSFDVKLSADGTKAFVADTSGGLQVIDVSNPAAPTVLGSYGNASTYFLALSADGTKAYLGNEANDFLIVDISNPASPTLLGTLVTTGYAYEIALSTDGTKAYLADSASLKIIDITNPAAPALIGSFAEAGGGGAFFVTLSPDGTKAFVGNTSSGLQILDVSTPAAPTLLGTYDTPGTAYTVTLSADGTKAFVADMASGLQIIDVSNPAAPTLLGTYNTTGSAWDVRLSADGTKAYLADASSGLLIIDISNPSAPTLLGTYNTAGSAYGLTLSADETKAYVADGASGLQIISLTTSPTEFSTATDTIAVAITAVNDAPVATGNATLAAIAEDTPNPAGATVASLFGANFSDSTDQVSGGSSAHTLAGIAITGYTVDAAQGAWQYSTDSGAHWTSVPGIGAETGAFTLQAATLLRFLPAADYNGPAPTLTTRLIDSSTTVADAATLDASTHGGSTALSDATVALNSSVTAVNDAPLLTGDLAASVAVGNRYTITSGDLGYTDPDDGNADITFTVSALGNGSIEVDGTSATQFTGTQLAAGQVRFVHDGSNTTSASFSVRVEDGNEDSSTPADSTFNLIVTPVNVAPVITSHGGDATASVNYAENGSTAVTTFTATDADSGDTRTFSISGGADAALFDIGASTGALTFKASPDFEGTGDNSYDVTVKVADAAGAFDEQTLTVQVTNVNEAPTLVNAIADQAATEDSPFSFTVPADAFADVDVDVGDTRSYAATLADGSALPAWLSFDAATRTFSGTPANGDVGTISVKVTATDGSNASADDSFDIVVANVNDAPTVANPIADQAATEDSAFSFTVPADAFADVDVGDTRAYTATLADGSALPAWLSFNPATRTFSGTPANADVGTLSVKVTATDGALASADDSFDIVVANVNDAPTLAHAIADQAATEDSAFSFTVPADAFADVDVGDSRSYAATLADGSALPAWLSFDAATRTFSGTPANADVGTISVKVTATDGSNAFADDSFDIVVADVNDAPAVANPIADQAATEDSAFSFTVPADVFADVDVGDTRSYVATLADGSALPAWLSFNPATRTFSGTPANADVGTISVKVTATDGSNASADDSFDIVVADVNDAPAVANPIADQAATEDSPFSFTVPADAFADVDVGDTRSYAATLADGSALPAWLSFNAATRTFSGTPANADVGTISVKVTATDGALASADDSFDIVVANVNDAPTLVNAIADQAATEDSPFSLTVPADAFADVDVGDSRAYTATLADGSALPAWLSFDAATRTFSGTPANSDVGTISVKLTAFDGALASADDSFDIVVADVNDAPTLVNAIADQAATEDSPFSFTVPVDAFADVDVDVGDTRSYAATLADGSALPAWLSFDATTRTFSGTPANGDVGTISVKVTATDGSNVSADDSFDIVVANVNDAPTVANPIADQVATEDSLFSFTVPADAFADVDVGDSRSYAATLADGSALPAWLSFDATTRTFSGTPANADVGTISVKLTAFDGALVSADDSFDIVVANVNDAPTLAHAIADQAATEDSPFSLTVPADAFADVDVGDSRSYAATLADGSALPAWLSFDAATRTFSGTPANADVGTLSVKFTATDDSNASADDSFDIVVANVNDAPTLMNEIADQAATEDSPFSLTVPADAFADVDVGDSRSYAATLADGSALPAWLSFDAATRTFSGTPANGDVGTISVKVTATDGSNVSADDSFDIVVANVNDAPTVANPIADQAATEDSPFSFTVPADVFADVDVGDTRAYTATLADGSALPAWLSFDATTRTFSGTPANGDVGTLSVKVTATDGSNASADDSFDIVVANVNDAPTLMNEVADQAATEDSLFSFTVPADAFADVDVGDTRAYTATLADGSALPAWLSFDATTRTFSGTPANGDVGTLSVKVTATDGSNASADDSFDIVVANVNDAPTVANPIADQAATEDSAFSFTVLADAFADVDVGDTRAYTATLADGSALPAWLSFDAATRTFSGTPANGDVGTISVKVTATDGSNASADDSFDIVVANVNDAPTVANPIADQAATEDSAFSFTVPADAFADVDVGDTRAYTATLADGSALPAWLSFNPATRTFSGTPANADVGTLSVKVTATDGALASADDSFDIVVANVNDAPTLAHAIADQAATEDSAFSFTVPADVFADVDVGDTRAYTATLADGSALPAWLSFDATTRTFSGTPANGDVGTISVKVTATDGALASADDSFDIVVANVNDAPTLAHAIADQAATEDSAFSFTVPADAFADVDVGDSRSYAATLADGSALPAWLSFDAATRTFSGTPANADVGTLSVKVTATDGALASADDSFDIVVANVNDAPTLAHAIADQAATEDSAFSFTVPADAFADVDVGDSRSYAATLADGSALPAWLSFDAATRTFSGTPANADVGTISVKVTATDGSNAFADDSFDIVVADVNDAPAVANPIADQAATEDSAFSFTVPADVFADVDVGDTRSYVATLADGSALPAWLSFNPATRTFSGTPANADVGTISVKVTATDGSNASADDSFDIVVADVNDAPAVANPIADQAATEDSPFSFTVPADAFADVDVGDTRSYAATLADGSALPAWLSFNAATRTFSGTPANADVGTISVKFTATDGSNASADDTFDIVVADVNDAPTWSDVDTAATAALTAQDTAVTGVLPAAGDTEGDTLSYGKAADPAHGSVTVSADGHYVYTPSAGFHGTDSFEVSVDDGHGGRSTLTVRVTVLPAPTLGLPAGSDLGSSSTDRITSAAVITLDGAAAAGQTLRLYGPQGQLIATVATDAQGRWSADRIDLSGMQGDDAGAVKGAAGRYSFSVRMVLPSGVESAPTPLTVTREIPLVIEAAAAPAPAPIPEVAAAEPAAAPAAAPQPAFDSALVSTPVTAPVASSTEAPRASTPPVTGRDESVAPPQTPTQRSSADGDIYTRSSGFQVMVTPSSEPSLKLFNGVQDQVVPMNRLLIVQVPADAFVHTVLAETVTLSASRADGTPLPAWLSFDSRSGKFVGEPPAGQAQDLAIRITARDTQGREATTMFRVKVTEAAGNGVSGRASFNQQLARGEALVFKPGQRAWQAQPRPAVMRRG